MSTTENSAMNRGATLRGLYRDRENGWIFGVCAGIAERFDFSVLTVRVLAVLSLILFTMPTALLYLAATMLLRPRPLTYRGPHCEQEFWRCRERHDHWRTS